VPIELPPQESHREKYPETEISHPPTLAGSHTEACGVSDASEQEGEEMDGEASGEKGSSMHRSASAGSDAEADGGTGASDDDQATSSSDAGFRAVIQHGYSQMSSEREEWLRSIGCTDQPPLHVPTILTAPAALRACSGGKSSKCPPEGSPFKSKLSAQPWSVPVAQMSWDASLKERSTDIAEELKRWTERMGRADWPPIGIS